MNKQTRASHPLYNLLPTEIEGFDSLAELALDMRWSWKHVKSCGSDDSIDSRNRDDEKS